MACECSSCERFNTLKRIVEQLPPEDGKWLLELYDQVATLETDRDYLKQVLAGETEGSERILYAGLVRTFIKKDQ